MPLFQQQTAIGLHPKSVSKPFANRYAIDTLVQPGLRGWLIVMLSLLASTWLKEGFRDIHLQAELSGQSGVYLQPNDG